MTEAQQLKILTDLLSEFSEAIDVTAKAEIVDMADQMAAFRIMEHHARQAAVSAFVSWMRLRMMRIAFESIHAQKIAPEVQ